MYQDLGDERPGEEGVSETREADGMVVVIGWQHDLGGEHLGFECGALNYILRSGSLSDVSCLGGEMPSYGSKSHICSIRIQLRLHQLSAI